VNWFGSPLITFFGARPLAQLVSLAGVTAVLALGVGTGIAVVVTLRCHNGLLLVS
jgi:hypothetical protein